MFLDDEPWTKPKRPWWKTALWVVFWIVAGLLGLFLLVMNWPLEERTQWGLAAMIAAILLNWQWNDYQERRERERRLLDERLDRIESEVRQIAYLLRHHE